MCTVKTPHRSNLQAITAQTLTEAGAQPVAPVTEAPWSFVSSVQAPDGMQITLFETSTLFDA